MEVYDDRLVGGEERLESLLVQGMRMLTSLPEDEEVIDVDDSDSDTNVSEDGSRGDGLESNLDTTSNKDDIGVETLFSRESLPDGCTGDAMLLGLLVSFA